MILIDDLARYVTLHHALGFKFRIQQGLLRSYVAFARAAGDDVVRANRVVAWASMALSAPQLRNSLEACEPDRRAVARHVVGLSTYLGHAHVTDTYWYLHATPTLMARIADAGEALYRGDAP